MVDWLEPPSGTGSRLVESNLPQAEIKFELGLQAIKNLCQDDNLVRIEIHNLDQEPVNWFELVEHPSGFLNTTNLEDDFGFRPLDMLYSSRILPWFLNFIPDNLLPQLGPQRRRILQRVRQALRSAHAPLLALAPRIDPLLSQFSTHDTNLERGPPHILEHPRSAWSLSFGENAA